MRKLHLLANIYVASGLNFLVKQLRGRSLGVPCLTYHRVIKTANDFPFDEGVVSATPDEFYKQMEYIKNNYNPISMDEYVDYVENNTPLPRASILITFDDGFDDNYHYAFPILKKLKIPATIFISTGFIDSEDVIWYERLAYFFKRTDKKTIEIPDLHIKLLISDDFSERNRCYSIMIEKLKLVDDVLRKKIIQELYSNYEDPYLLASEHERSLSHPLSWKQIREMSIENITFGSHTVTHPVLSMLEPEELKNELVSSKNKIQSKITKVVKTVAYPVGQRESYSKEVLLATQKAGYNVAFNYIDGIAKPKISEKYDIDRIHVDLSSPFSYFCAKLSLPELFCE